VSTSRVIATTTNPHIVCSGTGILPVCNNTKLAAWSNLSVVYTWATAVTLVCNSSYLVDRQVVSIEESGAMWAYISTIEIINGSVIIMCCCCLLCCSIATLACKKNQKRPTHTRCADFGSQQGNANVYSMHKSSALQQQ